MRTARARRRGRPVPGRAARRAALAGRASAREIGGDPEHAPGAERLDPYLLERPEDRLRDLAARREALVHLGVVMAQPQRCAVSFAAQSRQVLAGHGRRGDGSCSPGASSAGLPVPDRCRSAGRPGLRASPARKLTLRVGGAQSLGRWRRARAEVLPGVPCRVGSSAAVAGHTKLALPGLSASSMPRQRW